MIGCFPLSDTVLGLGSSFDTIQRLLGYGLVPLYTWSTFCAFLSSFVGLKGAPYEPTMLLLHTTRVFVVICLLFTSVVLGIDNTLFIVHEVDG